ncbi:EAL domain-containing protein [Sphingomonas montana]|uniref:EAL domain-containing protein n=1 Tax=Sphingomonas montana TaxID=1843236 RepID=UPI0013EB69FA|nr:EAL domain-containing protein [Sphingomonas montana]
MQRGAGRRALLWITLGCLLFGLLEAGAPLEHVLRNLRDRARQHAASGQIVVVGIDDRTVDAVMEWPLQRRYYARLVDRLNVLGARRIFIDLNFTTRSTPGDDRLLADAMRRSRAIIVLPSGFYVDPATRERREFAPAAMFRPYAQVANINASFDAEGVVHRLPFVMRNGTEVHPSFSALLAGRTGGGGRVYPIDYSIRLASVPVVSADAVMTGSSAAGDVAGKDIVIGLTSLRLGSNFMVPNVGLTSGIFLHVMGAETLLSGISSEVPWFVPFALAVLVVCVGLFVRRRLLRVVGYVLVTIGATALPFFLDAHLIFTEIIPTLVFLGAVGTYALWSQYRTAFRQRAVVNVVSGLPNLNALRAVAGEPDVALVAARVRNFPEVSASLPADKERALVEQIARRLALGSGGATIYQGDEGIFAWLMPCETVSFTSDQFDALHALFRNPVAIGDRHVDLAITFGLASDPDLSPFNRLGGALMAADAAAEAGLHWKLHEPAQQSDSAWRLSLLGRLDAAIDSGEIWVAYQPKIDLASGRIVGGEALVRWSHPEKGPISPVDFIPMAEQQNRIGKLTYHVMETAIRAAAAINGHGMEFGIAVNLSARLLDDPVLVERVAELLADHGLAPRLLTLEITETAALSDGSQAIAVLNALREVGVGLSIDDYGTGFSNLENLRTIPATEIKIDRSFIDAIDHSRSDAVMVRSTIQMAHSLGQTVVAEGVERAETLRALRVMRCDMVQGYLTGRPMKFAALSRMLLTERRRTAA